MSIERTDGRGEYIYRVNPAHRREVQRRRNRGRARWEPWCVCASEADAKTMVLRAKEGACRPT